VVVAVNRFSSDTDAEVATAHEGVEGLGVEVIDCTHWADGSKGTEKLAQHVAIMADKNTGQFAPLYDDDMPLWDKVKTVATKIYGADDIIADKKVRSQFADLQDSGYGNLPVCMAKTQYSFSTDPNLKGAPSGHMVPVREVRLSAGAGFVVVICGEIMTMPGLPRVPAANSIHLNKDGQIEGLF
jgi:formate--tetrahydrofolate ligase